MNKFKILLLICLCSFIIPQLSFTEMNTIISDSRIADDKIYKDYWAISIQGNAGAVFYITNTGNLTISSCTFYNNTTPSNDNGGAIYNSGFLSVSTNSYSFFCENTAKDANGGVLYNEKNSKSNIYGVFYSNEAIYGGAVYNAGTLNIIDNIYEKQRYHTFDSNSSSQYGGAIFNSSSTTTGSYVSFYNNFASFAGGAIYSTGTVNIGDNNFFTQNQTSIYGGAIAISSGTLNISNNVVFSTNSATNSISSLDASGGAIYIGENAVAIIDSDSAFGYNIAKSSGGAIINGGFVSIGGNKQKETNYFIENTASTGGAICNFGIFGFSNNVIFQDNKAKKIGGAIYSGNGDGGVLFVKAAGFLHNTANTAGGAIYISSNTNVAFCDGAVFKNNLTLLDSAVGAILNEGSLLLAANTENVIFEDNMSNNVSNAITDIGGEINLNASKSASVIFNDRIISKDNTSILNINKSSEELVIPIGGKIILNEDMSGYTGTVNLYCGRIQLGEKGTLFGGDYNIKNYAVIDMSNKVIQEHEFNRLTADYRFDLIVDADLEKKQMDTISAESYSGNEKINVKAINILKDSKEEETEIVFTTSTVLKDKITSVDNAYSKLYKYNVSYDEITGNLNFENVSYRTAIKEGTISVIGSQVSQIGITQQAFSSIDSNMSRIKAEKEAQRKAEQEAELKRLKQKRLEELRKQRQNNLKKNKNNTKNYTEAIDNKNVKNKNQFMSRNLYASLSNVIYPEQNSIERGLWLRPFVLNETIKIDEQDVNNNMYGTLAGIDLVVGDNSMLSIYLGYSGAQQKYDELKSDQSSYACGLTYMFLKDIYFLALTGNIVSNKVSANNDTGTDDLEIMSYGLAIKGGYDIELGKNWIIQPNLMLMYSNNESSDYTTNMNANIKGSSTTGIFVEPAIKLKLDKLSNGWLPYANVGYMLSCGDKAKTVVEDLVVESKTKDYIEYGIGTEKVFKNSSWILSGELNGRSGGRNGFGGGLGIKYSF